MPIEALLWSLLLVISPALALYFRPALRERLQGLPFDLEPVAPWIHGLGLPYLALILGSVSSRLVGLHGFPDESWLSGGLACVLGIGAAYLARDRMSIQPDPGRNLDAIFLEQSRWAFYQGTAALWFPLPLSSLVGFGVAMLELGITHLAARNLGPPSPMLWKVLMRAALSSVLFAATGNFWLTAGTQLLLSMLLVRGHLHDDSGQSAS